MYCSFFRTPYQHHPSPDLRWQDRWEHGQANTHDMASHDKANTYELGSHGQEHSHDKARPSKEHIATHGQHIWANTHDIGSRGQPDTHDRAFRAATPPREQEQTTQPVPVKEMPSPHLVFERFGAPGHPEQVILLPKPPHPPNTLLRGGMDSLAILQFLYLSL